MALTHRLFGIRSCNEVITGKRARPCLEYDIKRCIAPCVRHDLLGRSSTGGRWRTTQLFLEGRNDELIETLRERMVDAAERRAVRGGGAAARRDADGADAARPPAEDGHRASSGDRDVFGMKIGPERRRDPGVPDARRPRRRAHRARHRPGAHRRSRDADVLQAALQQFYEMRVRAGRRSTCRSRSDEREAMEAWLSARAGRRVRILVPQRGDKRGARRTGHAQRRARVSARASTRTRPHISTRSKRCGPCSALPALPRRIECFDISTIQGSETVASMVVCEDGRMKKCEYRKFRIKGVGGHLSRTVSPTNDLRPQFPDPGRFRRDARGRAAALSQGARSRADRFPT